MGGQALRIDDIDGSRWLADLQSACARNGQSAVMVLADQRGNDFLADDSDTLWSSTQYDAPSQRPNHGVESDEMSDTLKARTVRAGQGPKISGERVEGSHLTVVCTKALHAEYSDRKSGIKSVANDAGCNERTAKNWWQAKNLPDLANAVNLSKEAPSLALGLLQHMASHKNIFALLGELHRLAIMEAEHDADFAIEYGAFLQRHVIGRVK